MKALQVLGYGPDDHITVRDIAQPVPRAGEVRVRVQASGISYVDLLLARGAYQVRPTPPFIPGSEYAGVVDAIGPDTETGLVPGDLVCGTRQGAWAEYVCAPASRVHELPPGTDPALASVATASAYTALYALRERGGIRAGDTLLVLGAAGAVGHAAVQIGKQLGARVLALASTDAKRAAVRAAGADAVIDSGSDWKDMVKRQAGPRGVDLVFDPVGGAATDTAFRTLGWGGRHLMIGFAGGEIGALKTNLSIVKGAALVGVDVRQYGEREPGRADALLRECIRWFAEGRICPVLRCVLPVACFAQAAEHAQDRNGIGRVVITF
ncbi:NADPH:quinone oxidoreductase family protein [Pseudorhodoferax sp. Leaf274]|uniref:NADPH:quinone oxidoreductase family protein n=1 Tax=Pseudorhodoferax sp. Leaf274 TaxID=1736318 RepID=UPI0009E91B2D|nr:NADPH:quinone oxidoreductase family protein [Pseudorhodoferax sp. Leaf274]